METRSSGLSSGSPKKRSAPRPSVAVPSWYDLPLLLPDTSDPVLGRLQRSFLETLDTSSPAYTEGDNSKMFIAPKPSRLSPQKEMHRPPRRRLDDDTLRLGQWRRQGHKMALKPRKTTLDGAAVVLDRLYHQRHASNHATSGRRSTLRDKLWSDLRRFGLWHIGDGTLQSLDARDATQDVDAAVESILRQWNQQTGSGGEGELGQDDKEEEEVEEEERMESGGERQVEVSSAVFLTAVPQESNQRRASISHKNCVQTTEDTPEEEGGEEEDGEDEEEEEEQEEKEEKDGGVRSLASRFRREIYAPGLKRRRRLKELHVFVEKQLQKRLLRSWETIEIALSGSGELSVSQIVKFLQNSEVKLSAADAAKVHSALHQHLDGQRQAKRETEHVAAAATATTAATATSSSSSVATGSLPSSSSPSSAPPTKLSYATFSKIFQPRDTQDAARWQREFDRDKARVRQEKEIYSRELAALEDKVKKRLDASAKQMVGVLHSFRCDPLALPWASDAQRLELRDQFMRVIFSKHPPPRHRQQLLQAAEDSLLEGDAPTSVSVQIVELPEKPSVPRVRAALLQKYSRNGHFESVEVSVAAYLFHDMAADAIKASIRALWTRQAANQWPERQLIFQHRLRKAVFLEWRRFTKHADVLRVHVLRKFVAWAFWTRKQRAYYAFYRACFWPFYVWKRELQRMVIARGKAGFLKNAVHTYVQLGHFRAWKARYRRKCWCRQQVEELRELKARRWLRICWHDWLAKLRVHIHIHRLWKSRGHVLQRLHKGYMVKVTFVVWRYYTILRQDTAARQFKCLHAQFPPVGASQARVARVPDQHHARGARAGASGSLSPSRHQYGYQSRSTVASRGVSWSASAADGGSAPLGARSASMASAYGRASNATTSTLDDGVDAFVHEEGDEQKEKEDREEGTETHQVHSLSKIMETALAPKIKRKTKLYDLCLHLYLRFREHDQRAMTGNVILYRRVGRRFLRTLQAYVAYRKKSRMASDLGVFRHLYGRFRSWVSVSIYKHPLAKQDSALDKENAFDNRDDDGSDADNGGDDHDEATRLEKKADAIALDWRRDAKWRLRGLAALPLEANRLRHDLVVLATEQLQRMERVHELELQLLERKRLEGVFLRKEAGATLKVRALQTQQAQQILRSRGHRMHDVVDRAFDALLAQKQLQQLKSSFRSLRVAMMERYTATLCHRVQLRNWLRICKRFAFWQRHVARFHELRVKFHVVRSLLRHAVWKWKHESAGLSAALQQRQRLLWRYDQYLERHGLLTGSPSAQRLAVTKFSPANSFQGVFLRWVHHTQLSKTYRQIDALTRHKRELWRLHSVFQTLKTFLKAKYTAQSRRRNVPFLYRQCVANLDAVHCKMLTLRARLPTIKLRRHLRLTQHHLQQTATGAPTLKQLFQLHEQQIRHRLFLESRLMFVAYNERRVHHYAERSSPLFGTQVGRSFAYETAPPFGSISDFVVLCGKHVDAISLVLKTNASATVEGQLRGNPFGNREVFTLARGEKLISIEGFASQTIYGIRLGTSTGRLSKWYGHCEKGTKFELRADWSKREEIVGLFGYADATSIHALGCVFRHTTLRNIFEGMWLQPAKLAGGIDRQPPASASDGGGAATLAPPQTSGSDGVRHAAIPHARPHEEMSLSDRQFAYFLQVRMCDVLLAMKKAHNFALRLHRLAHTLPWSLTRTRVLMGLTRWYFNSLTHGLVRASDREEEGKRVLQDGMNKRAAGEKAVDEGTRMLAEVDSYRDSDKQLNVATLGVRKITELKEMIEQGEFKISNGKRLLDDGQREILQGRHILPHIPMTKRMVNAVRRIYKVVQTKDYIDQMDPEMRAILLDGESAAVTAPVSIYDPV